MKTKKQIGSAPLDTARPTRDYAEQVIQLQAARDEGILTIDQALDQFQAAYSTNSSHSVAAGPAPSGIPGCQALARELLYNQSLHVLGLAQPQQAGLLALLELQQNTFVALARFLTHQRRAAFAEFAE